MAKVWLRIAGAVACFVVALWLTADGRHAHPHEWVFAPIFLVVGLVLSIDATLCRVRIAIRRANERHRQQG